MPRSFPTQPGDSRSRQHSNQSLHPFARSSDAPRRFRRPCVWSLVCGSEAINPNRVFQRAVRLLLSFAQWSLEGRGLSNDSSVFHSDTTHAPSYFRVCVRGAHRVPYSLCAHRVRIYLRCIYIRNKLLARPEWLKDRQGHFSSR